MMKRRKKRRKQKEEKREEVPEWKRQRPVGGVKFGGRQSDKKKQDWERRECGTTSDDNMNEEVEVDMIIERWKRREDWKVRRKGRRTEGYDG
jgi:hypothetical protein